MSVARHYLFHYYKSNNGDHGDRSSAGVCVAADTSRRGKSFHLLVRHHMGSAGAAPERFTTAWWAEPIPWYSEKSWGEYRKNDLGCGYTRRELAIDLVIHAKGVVLSVVGVTMLLVRVATTQPVGSAVGRSLVVYGVSLVLMFLCSALFNGLAWNKRMLRTLQVADHGGILLLIAGTYTPVMTVAGCPRTPSVVRCHTNKQTNTRNDTDSNGTQTHALVSSPYYDSSAMSSSSSSFLSFLSLPYCTVRPSLSISILFFFFCTGK